MHSALYLSLTLLLWSLLTSALPLPSCLDSCKPVEPLELRYQEWDPDLGPLRRTARSAETLDDAGVLEPREDAIEHAVMKSERPVHRDVESVLSIVGKGERPVLTRAIRTLKERWGKWVGSDRELVMPVAPPGESDDPGTGSTSGKRWITLEDEAFIEKATVNDDVDATPSPEKHRSS